MLSFRQKHHSEVALSLLELCVAVAVLAILVVFMLPAIASIRDQGNAAKSLSNLRQCLSFLRHQADEKNGLLVFQSTGNPWIQFFWGAAYPDRTFPAWKNDVSNLKGTFFYDPGVSYDIDRGFSPVRTFAINRQLYAPVPGGVGIRLATLGRPASTALLATVGAKSGVSSSLMRSQINFRFRKGTIAHIGFSDGHVQAMNREELRVPLNTYEDVFWKGE